MSTQEPQVKSIAENTVLLKVSFGTLGNSRKVPNSIIEGAAGSNLLKIQKTLLESKELKAIQTADGKMRSFLYDMALPYSAPLMLVPMGEAGEYLNQVHHEMLNFAEERKALVEDFIVAYPKLVKEAEERIKAFAAEIGVPFEQLWSPQDYPPVEIVRSKFYFEWDYHSFAVPDALKLAGIYDETKNAAAEKLHRAAEEITVILRQTLLDLVNHLKDALEPNQDGKPKRIFASSVTNIQSFLDSFHSKNITNDVELEKLVGEVHSLIHPGFEVENLKKDEGFKEQVSKALGGFSEKLTDLVEVVPGRKFKEAA